MTQHSDQDTYENRLVAFIDLQGFASEVKSIGDDEKKFFKILNMLKRAKTLEDKQAKKKMYEGMPSLSKDESSIMANGYQCTVISDSIIISFPATKNGIFSLSLELALMQWMFLWHWNFLLRGYVSEGKCYHKDGIVFGDAYQAAYYGAENDPTHTYPYILIDNDLVDNFSRQVNVQKEALDATWTKDHLNRYYINYASSVGISNMTNDLQINNSINFLKKNLNNNELSSKIREKYNWTYKYLIENNDKFKKTNSLLS